MIRTNRPMPALNRSASDKPSNSRSDLRTRPNDTLVEFGRNGGAAPGGGAFSTPPPSTGPQVGPELLLGNKQGQWLFIRDIYVNGSRGLGAECGPRTVTMAFPVYPNLLPDCGWRQLTGLDQAWEADLTYVRLGDGFCYLAVVLDLFSRKIVGRDLSESLEAQGALAALEMALTRRRPAGYITRIEGFSTRAGTMCNA